MDRVDLEFEQAAMRQRWARIRRGEVITETPRRVRKQRFSRPCKCGCNQFLGRNGWSCRSCGMRGTFADEVERGSQGGSHTK